MNSNIEKTGHDNITEKPSVKALQQLLRGTMEFLKENPRIAIQLASFKVEQRDSNIESSGAFCRRKIDDICKIIQGGKTSSDMDAVVDARVIMNSLIDALVIINSLYELKFNNIIRQLDIINNQFSEPSEFASYPKLTEGIVPPSLFLSTHSLVLNNSQNYIFNSNTNAPINNDRNFFSTSNFDDFSIKEGTKMVKTPTATATPLELSLFGHFTTCSGKEKSYTAFAEFIKNKTILSIGGGKSCFDILNNEQFNFKKLVNVDPFTGSDEIKMNKQNKYESLMMSADDTNLKDVIRKETGVQQFDEIWASYSLPLYTTDNNSIFDFWENVRCLLAPGGIARITPFALNVEMFNRTRMKCFKDNLETAEYLTDLGQHENYRVELVKSTNDSEHSTLYIYRLP